MGLRELLADRKAAVVGRWLDRVLATYPADTGRFLRQTKDAFANPVGTTLAKELPVLYDAVVGSGDASGVGKSLEAVVRLRAVQDFTPSQAVAFVFLLKAAVRDELGEALRAPGRLEEWDALESDIDAVALAAFDAFAANRERMCEIRINAMKKRTYILERAAFGLPGDGRGEPVP